MKIEHITSPNNSKVKLIRELYIPKGRKKHGLFIAEGIKEISMAHMSGFNLHSIFINENFIHKKDIEQFPFKNSVFYQLDTKLFSKISYREDTEGIIAIFESKYTPLNQLKLSSNPFLIILEAIEKPGNLGAILRTADAVKADAVIVCNPVIDLYNPNVIRSSLGCIFTVPVAISTNEETLIFLKTQKINIFATALQNSSLYYEVNFKEPTALVFGTEAHGLSQFWRKEATAIIRIPMLGKIDSLNVSNSVAVLCYEVLRQRR
ncbi:MAG: RNA methyltransferase [Bacteroidales bacterium]|nr:RNA methyltransferase [Bacteroidales bacterium]